MPRQKKEDNSKGRMRRALPSAARDRHFGSSPLFGSTRGPHTLAQPLLNWGRRTTDHESGTDFSSAHVTTRARREAAVAGDIYIDQIGCSLRYKSASVVQTTQSPRMVLEALTACVYKRSLGCRTSCICVPEQFHFFRFSRLATIGRCLYLRHGLPCHGLFHTLERYSHQRTVKVHTGGS